MKLALKIADYFGFAKLRLFAEEFVNRPSGATGKAELFVTLAVAGAKAHRFRPFTARLKSCPDTNQEFFSSLFSRAVRAPGRRRLQKPLGYGFLAVKVNWIR
jgi:hypothetical protein